MTKRRWPFVAVVPVAVTAALLTVGAGAALAKKQPVACGQVIMHSIHLRNDLIDCPGDGLVIGADDVTLDLNRHTIDGTGVGIGVLNGVFGGAEGHERVTVDPYAWNEGAVRAWERAGFVEISRHDADEEHTAPWILMEFRG